MEVDVAATSYILKSPHLTPVCLLDRLSPSDVAEAPQTSGHPPEDVLRVARLQDQ